MKKSGLLVKLLLLFVLVLVSVPFTPLAREQDYQRPTSAEATTMGVGSIRFDTTITLGVVLHLFVLLAGLFSVYIKFRHEIASMHVSMSRIVTEFKTDMIERLTRIETQLAPLWEEYRERRKKEDDGR